MGDAVPVRGWQGWLSERFRMMPTFLVIGAMRGGTTSLYRYLCMHPRVLSAARKEVHFFDHHFRKGPGWYRAQFASRFARVAGKAGPLGRITGEASPSYMLNPLAPGRAAALLPGAKLIAILRDPVDRAFSHYNQAVRRGYETLAFEEALAKEAERLRGEREKLITGEVEKSLPFQHYSYRLRGHYMEQVEAWLRHYPRERLLVLISEEFYADPGREVKRVTDFLGIPPVALPRSEELEKFNQFPYDGMRPETRAELAAYFRPHNARLAEFLGRDPGWSR